MKPQKYNIRSPKKSIFTLNPCFLLLQLITGYKHRICFFFFHTRIFIEGIEIKSSSRLFLRNAHPHFIQTEWLQYRTGAFTSINDVLMVETFWFHYRFLFPLWFNWSGTWVFVNGCDRFKVSRASLGHWTNIPVEHYA